MRIRRLAALFIVIALCSLPVGRACAQKACAYLQDDGTVVEIDNQGEAPPRYRTRVVCADDQKAIPQAEDVEILGGVKTAEFVTDLGPIAVKWPRSVERCFGRSPAKAVADAAQTVNRALASAPFPPSVKNRSRAWSLVFTDKATALREFPASLTIGGHPGFMVPPNNIYLITDYISPSCDPSQMADSLLAQVLLHEIGHVIEFLMLGKDFGLDRQRAEGFASWFEQYSSDYSRVIPKGSVKEYYRKLATEAMRSMPAPFAGTAYDYARAALQFEAIVSRKGLNSLMSVYSAMSSEGLSFTQALEKQIRWNRKVLDQEMERLVK